VNLDLHAEGRTDVLKPNAIIVGAKIDAEFLANMGEFFRIGEAAVHHHRPQRRQACLGEEQPRQMATGIKLLIGIQKGLRLKLGADSNEGGHLFQSDRGHHSNLTAASSDRHRSIVAMKNDGLLDLPAQGPRRIYSQVAVLLHTSFGHRLAMMPLCFAKPHLQVGWGLSPPGYRTCQARH
jgi:hypothetical protein